jgi:hypothetical protein
MTAKNGITQFVFYGTRLHDPYHTLAADSDGTLFLESSDNANPGWVLTSP